MAGSVGNDIYIVENSGDVVWENTNQGTDTVYSSLDYWLSSNVEQLVLFGSAIVGVGNEADNLIIGDSANNTLNGLAGVDTMEGGVGDDAYIVDNSNDYIWENVGEGKDTVYSSADYWLSNDVEQLILTGAAAMGTGNASANLIVGNDANNTLNGDAGADVLVGGKGDDSYIVDNSSDFVFENAGEGFDAVYSLSSFTLNANVEVLVLMGTAVDGTGNTEDNYLVGNSGNNTLIGWTGWDVLIGGQGKDSYNLSEPTASTDTVQITAGDSLVSNYDTVSSFTLGGSAGADRLDLDNATIAANTAGSNGVDSGSILSHSISNGIISFDDIDSYSAPVAVTAANFANVLSYLQSNIGGNEVVAFTSEGSTFVFQDAVAADTLVELVGVTANSLSNSGATAGSVWVL
jgi:Ca2+-binding RTX toxin-like protein